MTASPSNPTDPSMTGAQSASGRERDLDALDRRAHGGSQNGSTESAREHQLSEQVQRTGGPTQAGKTSDC